jgi:hypothetical protein
VIELLVTAMGRIPQSSLDLLKLGACFGNLFDIRHVSFITSMSIAEAEPFLWVAIRDGMQYIGRGYLEGISRVHKSSGSVHI